MTRQIELIHELYDTTIRMNEALLSKDLSTLEEMIEKRAGFIEEYNTIKVLPLEASIQLLVDKLFQVDEENRRLLENLMMKEKKKLDTMRKEKNNVQKRTTVAKKYVTAGYTKMDYSEFNKKT